MKYETMCYLLNLVTLVLTDSGGLQEEAVTLGKPVLIMREDTERPEALNTGLARLVGTSVDSVVHQTIEVLLRESSKRENLNVKNPFGRGDAAQQIVSLLADV
jgi:UDP-N-acetylglucosamine 2-epimerase (non-hydrolysing)